MKEKIVEINEYDTTELLSGIPIEIEGNEPWRKPGFSCSGTGRLEKKFDLKHIDPLFFRQEE